MSPVDYQPINSADTVQGMVYIRVVLKVGDGKSSPIIFFPLMWEVCLATGPDLSPWLRPAVDRETPARRDYAWRVQIQGICLFPPAPKNTWERATREGGGDRYGIKGDLSRGFRLIRTEWCKIVKCWKVGQWKRQDRLSVKIIRAFPPWCKAILSHSKCCCCGLTHCLKCKWTASSCAGHQEWPGLSGPRTVKWGSHRAKLMLETRGKVHL